MNKLSLFFASAFAACALPALAYWTPVQINLVDVVGLPPAAESVYGVRVNVLYGSCDDVALADVGIFNQTAKGAYGIRAGVFNCADEDAYGISVGAFNFDTYNAGLEVGAFNLTEDGAGVQIGLFNGVNAFTGLQVGIFNVAAKEFKGVQIGLLNFSLESDIPFLPLIYVSSGNSNK